MILSGLKQGEPVITGPYKILDQLQHDQKVKPESAPPTTQPAGATTQPSAATQPSSTQPAAVRVPSPGTPGEG
jgi:hypothetical protein